MTSALVGCYTALEERGGRAGVGAGEERVGAGKERVGAGKQEREQEPGWEEPTMAPSIGLNLRVTGHCNQGGRKYMEDVFSVAYQQTDGRPPLVITIITPSHHHHPSPLETTITPKP